MEATSEQIHRLADTTYRNVEDLVTDLRGLTVAAKTYHRAMESMVSASRQFFTMMECVGAKAANLPGSVRSLGVCMKEMVEAFKKINDHDENVVQSMGSDFIVPLDMKLDTEAKNIAGMHKSYKLDNAKRQTAVEKSSGKLRSVQKKKNPSRAQIQKETELKQVVSDLTGELHSTRVEGLRRALLEERKMYIFVVDHFCTVVHNEISLNALSHRILSTKVMEWTSQCSSPNALPPESAILLVDPRSPRAFPTPASRSGDQMSPRQLDMSPQQPEMTSSSNGGVEASAAALQSDPKLRTRRVSCRVKALYPHQAAQNAQLEFTPGDLIDAIDDPQDGWQFGENIKTGRTGWFPVQYVDKVWPTPEPVRYRRRDGGGGSGGGTPRIADSNFHGITPTGRPLSLQVSPVSIPERDYQSSTVPGYHADRPSSGGRHRMASVGGPYGDQYRGGGVRRPSQGSVVSPGPGYKQ